MFQNIKKGVLVVLIVLVLLALFFIATRDYEKFKLLERNQIVGLDEQTKAVISATKICNQLDEKYRKSCYIGIGAALGNDGIENFTKCKQLDNSIRSFCYVAMGKFLGEKYDNLTLIIQKCSEIKLESMVYEEKCEFEAIEELAKKYAKNITYAEQFCNGLKRKYRHNCFRGLGKGIAQYHFQTDYESLKLCNDVSWTITCRRGYFEQLIYTQEKEFSDVLKMMDLSYYSTELIIHWSYSNAKKNLKDPQLAFTLCNQFSNLTYKEGCYKGVSIRLGEAEYVKERNILI